jgi:hypothetical protein
MVTDPYPFSCTEGKRCVRTILTTTTAASSNLSDSAPKSALEFCGSLGQEGESLSSWLDPENSFLFVDAPFSRGRGVGAVDGMDL